MKRQRSNQQNEVRINQKNYCDKWADYLWEKYRPAVEAADDMEWLVGKGLEVLHPTEKEVEEIAMRLRQKLRDEARPADTPSRPSRDRLYK